MRRLSLCLLLLLATTSPAAAEVKTGPIGAKVVRAFRALRFDRPIVVTHAGDGSNRLFVAGQKGLIHVFPNRPDADEKSVFLNIRKKVVYKDKENEEGLLGFAFHPKYKENGQFFLYYTTTSAPHTSVISRFRVSKDDPNKADAAFEEEIMRIKQPFWNHNGGTIVFGPDGYLYIGLGDGGAANDPHKNGQNLKTLLGSILRIDVDKKDPGKAYAVPKDNPFVNTAGARPEIWAYGLRNVWRMSFDPKTKTFWAADVGQNLWEEINIIVRGGNYGWNIREAMHPFPPESNSSSREYINPIWEYHHSVGKSITGGHVYRGKAIPALLGKYIYADYVSGKVWALETDEKNREAIGNYDIEVPKAPAKLPVMTFGEDQDGEQYLTTPFGMIYRLEAK